MRTTSDEPRGADATEAAAERAWVVRYSNPQELATLVDDLPDGPQRQVLQAFKAWREQRLDEAADLTMTLGYDASVAHLWRSRALTVRAGLLVELGLIREAFGVREHALEQARLGHHRVEEIACIHGFAVLFEQTDPERAHEHYVRTLQLIDDAHDATEDERSQLEGLRAVAVVNLYALADYQGLDVPAWVPSLAEVRKSALRAWPDMGAVITATLAGEALEAGDLDTASQLAAECPDPRTMRDVAISPTVAIVQARLLAARGDVDGAVTLLEEVGERLPPRHQPETLDGLMKVHESVGDIPAAYDAAKRRLVAIQRLQLSSTAAAVRALEVIYRTRNAEAEARRAAREAELASRTLGSLKEETTRDELTGVRNRRYLATVAPGILALPDAALAIVDIDRFKEVNDRRGHVVGDAVLVRVAEALTSATRAEDVVARYGGDEFVVLRPTGGGESLAADLRPAVRLGDSEDVDVDGAAPVTLSIGVADTRTDWEVTLRSADQVMYDVKRAGGGDVHHAG